MPAHDRSANQTAARRAARIAAKHGVTVAPLTESDQLLWHKFDGNVGLIRQIIAYYDEHDDELVINWSHEAWASMRRYIQDPRRKGHFSSRSPHHIIRHEIGHALHFRSLTETQRAEIWYKELTLDEQPIASAVSFYARTGRTEFVAEVYAALWGRRRVAREVMDLYRKLNGPPL
jgi:hypothetical protein